MAEISDRDGYFVPKIGEQLGYRYQVMDIVDKGAFGQVVKAIDLKTCGKEVAIKISRNKKFDLDNSKVETKILERLKSQDPQNK